MAKQSRAGLRALLSSQPAAPEAPAEKSAAEQPAEGIYPLSTSVRSDELPVEAEGLGKQLHQIARRYLAARRRSGEALLEAARHISEARQIAEEGTWHLFLQVTKTSEDMAERLINIHLLASRRPDFEAAVIHGRLNQSVAALLARPSTPPTAVDEVLTSSVSPSVADVQRLLRVARQSQRPNHHPVDNVESPQFADSTFSSTDTRSQKTLDPTDRVVIQQVTTLLQTLAASPQPLADADLALLSPLVDALQQLLERSTKDS